MIAKCISENNQQLQMFHKMFFDFGVIVRSTNYFLSFLASMSYTKFIHFNVKGINECSSHLTNNCNKKYGVCIDTEEGYTCSCKEGFTGDGYVCSGKLTVKFCSTFLKNLIFVCKSRVKLKMKIRSGFHLCPFVNAWSRF